MLDTNFIEKLENVVAMQKLGATDGEREASKNAVSRLIKRATHKATSMKPHEANYFLARVERITGEQLRTHLYPVGTWVAMVFNDTQTVIGKVIAIDIEQYTIRTPAGKEFSVIADQLKAAPPYEEVVARMEEQRLNPVPEKAVYTIPMFAMFFAVGFGMTAWVAHRSSAEGTIEKTTEMAERASDIVTNGVATVAPNMVEEDDTDDQDDAVVLPGHTVAYTQGVQERLAYYSWIDGLTGDYLKGVVQGASATCVAGTGDLYTGCMDAHARFGALAARMQSDAEFKAGWDSLQTAATAKVVKASMPVATSHTPVHKKVLKIFKKKHHHKQ